MLTYKMMEYKFPNLSFSKDADVFLQSIMGGKNIVEQLLERRITNFEMKDLISSAGIFIADDGNFGIAFQITDTLLEKARSLGHEIGHTFHFDLTSNPPRPMLNRREISPEMFDIVEAFCDEFSLRWLEINDKIDILNQIEKTLKLTYLR